MIYCRRKKISGAFYQLIFYAEKKDVHFYAAAFFQNRWMTGFMFDDVCLKLETAKNSFITVSSHFFSFSLSVS